MNAPANATKAGQLAILRQTLAAYGKLGGGWPPLTAAIVSVSKDSGIDPATAGPYGSVGWLRGQSETKLLPATPDGRVLAGEWLLDATASVHLRADPHDIGKLAKYTYRENGVIETSMGEDDFPVLRQVQKVLASRDADSKYLVYHVFWGADAADPHGLRRLFHRFAGFEAHAKGV